MVLVWCQLYGYVGVGVIERGSSNDVADDNHNNGDNFHRN